MKEENIIDLIQTFSKLPLNNMKLYTAIKWIDCLQQGKTVFDKLREKEIEEIIVYGIAELGDLLVKEAINNNYKIIAITDRRIEIGGYNYVDIPAVNVDELYKWKDKCIVVTAVTFYEEIEKDLLNRGYEKIVPLWDLL